MNFDAPASVAYTRAQAVPVLIFNYDWNSGLDSSGYRLRGKMEICSGWHGNLYTSGRGFQIPVAIAGRISLDRHPPGHRIRHYVVTGAGDSD